MKKLLGYIVAGLLLVMPTVTFAVEKIDLKDYETMGLKETLASEEMELSNADYKETDNQVTIYLFRGLGCGFCRNFLTFLNSISKEYGEKFKLVSFETWNDNNNSELLGAISNFIGEPAEGVPYVIIGDQVFPGYTSSYDDGIKEAIDTLYATEVSKRYDVFEAYNDKLVEDAKAEKSAAAKPIIWNFIFITIATIVIVCRVNKAKNEVVDAVKATAKKEAKAETKPKTTKKKK